MKGLIYIYKNGHPKKMPFSKLEFNQEIISSLSRTLYGEEFPCPKQLAYIHTKLVLEVDSICEKNAVYSKEDIPNELKDILVLPKKLEALEVWS